MNKHNNYTLTNICKNSNNNNITLTRKKDKYVYKKIGCNKINLYSNKTWRW